MDKHTVIGLDLAKNVFQVHVSKRSLDEAQRNPGNGKRH
jgi:hypothetical protein